MANVKQQLDIPATPSLGSSGEIYSQSVQNQNNGLLRLFFTKLVNAIQSISGPRGGKYLNNPYGAFQSTVDQTAAAANTAYAMTLNTTDYANGVSVASSSRITVDDAGIWNLQWSGQFENTDSQDHDVRVWIKVNGTNLTGSTGFFAIPSKHGSVDGHGLVGWNYYLSLNANDYIELWWESDSALVSLQAYAAGTNYPSTASLITTMNYISPSALTNIYASSQGQGTATITHFANSTANKKYRYAIIG